MNISFLEAKETMDSWAKDSLPVKLVFLDKRSGVLLSLKGEAWPTPDKEDEAVLRLGVESVAEFIFSLSEDGLFDLEAATEAPEDIRAEVESRTVRCLTCSRDDITLFLYERWAAPEEVKPIS